MVRRCIGIDIGLSYLNAVQILRTGETFHIEKVFGTQIRRTTDLLPVILKKLFSENKFDRRANVAVSMPYSAAFFRNLETDSPGLERIRGLDKSTLEHNFPIQSDEILAQVCSCHQMQDEKYSVLVAAVTKTSLRERLNTLLEAKIRPVLVDAAIFAIHSAVIVNHPEAMTGTAVIAFIDESHITLAVTQNNDALIVRNIQIVAGSEVDAASSQQHVAELLAREAEITWRKAFGTEINENTKIYLATANGIPSEFEAAVKEDLRCRIIAVNPCEKVENLPGCKADAKICVAEGLALRVLAPDKTVGINFLNADNADVKPALNLKRELITYAGLAAAIGIIALVGLFMRLVHLETKYAHIKKEIKEIFQSTLPDEKNIVSPLLQLDQKLQSLRKDYAVFDPASETGFGPLEVLYAITTSLPSGTNITLSDVLITTDSVRLTGIAKSFEAAYGWQRLLQKTTQFATVDIQNVGMEPKSELVHFTVLISLAAQEQK